MTAIFPERNNNSALGVHIRSRADPRDGYRKGRILTLQSGDGHDNHGAQAGRQTRPKRGWDVPGTLHDNLHRNRNGEWHISLEMLSPSTRWHEKQRRFKIVTVALAG